MGATLLLRAIVASWALAVAQPSAAAIAPSSELRAAVDGGRVASAVTGPKSPWKIIIGFAVALVLLLALAFFQSRP